MTTFRNSKTDVIRKLRNCFARSFNNNPEVLPVMATPPTVTLGTAADGTLTKFYAGDKVGTLLDVTGVQKYIYNTSTQRGAVVTQNRAADGGNAAVFGAPLSQPFLAGDHVIGPYYYKFMTDAPKLLPRFVASAANRNIRVIVDGQYVNRTGWDMSGSNNYLTIDFGSRKVREVWLECQSAMVFFSITVDPLSRIWRVNPASPIRAAITGDSHTENDSGLPTNIWDGATAVMARQLGIWDMVTASIGSTGYLRMGSSGVRKTIRSQMDDWVNNGTYQLIIFSGGFNDTVSLVPDVQAEALLCWQKARAAQPNALIVHTGVWGAVTGPGASIIAIENGLKSAFAAWADPFSGFISNSTLTEPREFGTGNTGATNGTGNADVYGFTDSLHYNTPGQNYRGCYSASDIRGLVENLAA